MATLTAFKFDTPEGAEQMLHKVQDLQKQQLITIIDAATVTWPEGKKAPKTRQVADMAGVGALGGAFWGLLFGLIFFVPIFGMAVGAAMGALAGSMRDYGISDEFINKVRQQVTEGTSALFLMTQDAVRDKVLDQLKGMRFELVASNLSAEQEQQLREIFAAQEPVPAM